MSKTKIMPFGVSEKWLQQRDDEMTAERALPISAIRNSEPYQTLLRLFVGLEKENADLKAQLARYEQAKIARRKPSSATKSNRGRQAAAPILKTRDDGVSWYSYAHIAKLKGLNVSNVSRQAAKKSLSRKRFEDGVWRIPASQAENIERRAYNLS